MYRRTHRYRCAILAIVIAACRGNPAPAPAAVATPSRPVSPVEVHVTLAEVGLEAASLDRRVDPCVDFYQFACGGWLAKTEIPADHAGWARATEIEARTRSALRALLEEAGGTSADPASRKLGDYYASCMDEAALERTGIAPIKGLLATTAGVKDARSWFAALVELHRLGFPVVWSIYAGADARDSTVNVLHLDVARLELPDRDYYLAPAFADTLAGYRRHVAKMLALAGVPAARAPRAAADVVAIATEIAKRTKPAVERRDSLATYNPIQSGRLANQVKSIDWAAYWRALNITPSETIVVVAPTYFAQLDGLRAKFTPAQWASYFTYHAVSWQSFSLGRAIDDQDFELEKLLSGATARPERRERCVEATASALRDLLGQLYVARHFPPSSKQAVIRLVDAIVAAMANGIRELDWISEPTRAFASAKLDKLVRTVGYPDTWRSYDFVVERDDFAGNELRRNAFHHHRDLARAGKPVDRSEWHMPAFAVNAYYARALNHAALPAGILQPPYFGPDRSIAANLGGIGMMIGHELMHGFDDQGARYDAAGNLKDWWQPDDKAAFEARAACVADQYSTFEALPGQFVNGRLTLGENIADLGGVKAAFRAYRALRKDAAWSYIADGLTEDQQFFVAVAQAWCSKERPASLQRTLAADGHAPINFRIYGALRNLRELGEAFRCARGMPMHPIASCQVW